MQQDSDDIPFNEDVVGTTNNPINLAVKTFKTNRGKDVLMIGGFAYYKNRENKKSSYWRCEEYTKKECRAAVTMSRKGEISFGVHSHTHEVNHDRKKIADVVNSLKTKATENPSKMPSELLNELKNEHPALTAKLPKKNTLKRSIFNRRKALLNPRLNSIPIQPSSPDFPIDSAFLTVKPAEPIESVVVKPEPMDMNSFSNEALYCRCCFKMLSITEEQYPVISEMLQAFEEITQLELEYSHIATSFCGGCYNDINSFSQFKKLAILKQEKFNEIMRNFAGDINCLHNMKLGSDRELDVKIEDDESTAHGTADVSKLTTDNFIAKQCKQNLSKTSKSFLQTLPTCNPLSTIESCYQQNDLHQNKLFATKVTKESLLRICPFCGKSFIGLQHHIKAVHEHRNLWCDICSYSCHNRFRLANHMRNKHLSKIELSNLEGNDERFSNIRNKRKSTSMDH